MNAKNLLEKRVFSIFDGQFCGTTKAFFCSNFKLKYLVIEKEKDIFLLKTKDIFCVSKKNLLVKNIEKLFVAKNFKNFSFFKKEVVTITGKNLGKIKTIYVNDNFSITKFSTKNKSFLPKQILSFSDAIIITTKNLKFTKSFFKPNVKIYFKKNNQIAKILEKK